MVGARAAAGTPCARQTPAIPCSGEVESAWGSMVEALACFIGAGARARALGVLWHVQGTSNTRRCSSAHVQKLAEIANVQILAKIRRRPLPGTYRYLLYVSSKGR
jgi:hypothetical protein